MRVTCLPIKQVGLSLPDPSQTAPENWTASYVITGIPSRGTQGPGGVPDSGPLGLPPGGTDGGSEKTSAEIVGGSDGRTGGGPGLTRTLTATSNKDRGLADSAAAHSQWDGTGGTGMAQHPIPTVWP